MFWLLRRHSPSPVSTGRGAKEKMSDHASDAKLQLVGTKLTGGSFDLKPALGRRSCHAGWSSPSSEDQTHARKEGSHKAWHS